MKEVTTNPVQHLAGCSAIPAQEKLDSVLINALTSIACLGNICRIHSTAMLWTKILLSCVNITFNLYAETLHWV